MSKNSVGQMVDHFLSSGRDLISEANAALKQNDLAKFDSVRDKVAEMGVTKLIASTISSSKEKFEDFKNKVLSITSSEPVKFLLGAIAAGIGAVILAAKVGILLSIIAVILLIVGIVTAVKAAVRIGTEQLKKIKLPSLAG